ncbi:hypothetical protein GEW_03102 [Pasteurella multocida subsp. gallicida str. Anand1_poultry]|nr:hypothetical protein GEW_03102 [Pasteurella multocida subsp. gallicida str. Anand1_poultry]
MIVDKVIKEYPNGVYEARVLIPNPKAKPILPPEVFGEKGKNQGVSTMFPRTWTEDRLKVELEHAFRNRSRVADTKNKWEGTTKSGVKVEWVINKDGYLSTVYPTEKTMRYKMKVIFAYYEFQGGIYKTCGFMKVITGK